VVLVAGAVLLAVLWLIGPRSQPPLYDTIGPGEPYRYCQPPPGFGPGKAPSQRDDSLPVPTGQSPPITPSTDEMPPQAELLAPEGAFAVPPGTATIRVAIQCAPPPSVLPPDGRLDGNVYTFTVAAAGTQLSLRPGQRITVVLRGPAGAPNPVMERFQAGQWMRLDTGQLGNTAPDTYAANVTELGDIALVVSNTVVPVGDDHTTLLIVLTAVAVALAAAGAVFTLRRRPGGGGRAARRGQAP
jgi:hypothetical protein